MCTHCHQHSDSPLFSHIFHRILLEFCHMGVDKIGQPRTEKFSPKLRDKIRNRKPGFEAKNWGNCSVLNYQIHSLSSKTQNSIFYYTIKTQPAFEGVTRASTYARIYTYINHLDISHKCPTVHYVIHTCTVSMLFFQFLAQNMNQQLRYSYHHLCLSHITEMPLYITDDVVLAQLLLCVLVLLRLTPTMSCIFVAGIILICVCVPFIDIVHLSI